jgi:tetratricopeptide (TPR) repeat protein
MVVTGMGMVSGSIINRLQGSPRLTRGLLFLSWAIFVSLGILASTACFGIAFLPKEQQLNFSILDLIILIAGLKLFSVFLASLHELRMKQLFPSQPGFALNHLHWALRITPGNFELHYAWGHLLFMQGDLLGARQRYQHVLKLFPLESPAAVYLGRLELSVGNWDEACFQFGKAYRLRRGIAWNDLRENILDQVSEALPTKIRTSWTKLNFDQQQLDFLIQGRYLPASFKNVLDNYRNLMRNLSARGPIAYPLWLKAEEHAEILPVWGRNYYVSPVPEFPSRVVKITDATQIESQFQSEGLVVIDNFLAPDALEALLHFCQKSSIWHDDHKEGGYLGSYIDDGFNCPLLYQTARELKETLPSILGAWSLLQMWGYNHDSQCQGIGLHADMASVNVNFWLTPDNANLDPEHGGLLVYPLEAPAEWNFDSLNNQTEQMKAFIADKKIQPITIPYQQNRAVIFRSRYFHATDQVHFEPGFLNRRINVTLLFGRYQPEL